jgi:hypothetical protein
MTVLENSRYSRTYDIINSDGKLHLSRRRVLNLPKSKDDDEYITVYGDLLWMLAAKHYGDPDAWWIISDYNKLSRNFEYNSIGIPTGTKLLLPKHERVLTELNK